MTSKRRGRKRSKSSSYKANKRRKRAKSKVTRFVSRPSVLFSSHAQLHNEKSAAMIRSIQSDQSRKLIGARLFMHGKETGVARNIPLNTRDKQGWTHLCDIFNRLAREHSQPKKQSAYTAYDVQNLFLYKLPDTRLFHYKLALGNEQIDYFVALLVRSECSAMVFFNTFMEPLMQHLVRFVTWPLYQVALNEVMHITEIVCLLCRLLDNQSTLNGLQDMLGMIWENHDLLEICISKLDETHILDLFVRVTYCARLLNVGARRLSPRCFLSVQVMYMRHLLKKDNKWSMEVANAVVSDWCGTDALNEEELVMRALRLSDANVGCLIQSLLSNPKVDLASLPLVVAITLHCVFDSTLEQQWEYILAITLLLFRFVKAIGEEGEARDDALPILSEALGYVFMLATGRLDTSKRVPNVVQDSLNAALKARESSTATSVAASSVLSLRDLSTRALGAYASDELLSEETAVMICFDSTFAAMWQPHVVRHLFVPMLAYAVSKVPGSLHSLLVEVCDEEELLLLAIARCARRGVTRSSIEHVRELLCSPKWSGDLTWALSRAALLRSVVRRVRSMNLVSCDLSELLRALVSGGCAQLSACVAGVYACNYPSDADALKLLLTQVRQLRDVERYDTRLRSFVFADLTMGSSKSCDLHWELVDELLFQEEGEVNVDMFDVAIQFIDPFIKGCLTKEDGSNRLSTIFDLCIEYEVTDLYERIDAERIVIALSVPERMKFLRLLLSQNVPHLLMLKVTVAALRDEKLLIPQRSANGLSTGRALHSVVALSNNAALTLIKECLEYANQCSLDELMDSSGKLHAFGSHLVMISMRHTNVRCPLTIRLSKYIYETTTLTTMQSNRLNNVPSRPSSAPFKLSKPNPRIVDEDFDL